MKYLPLDVKRRQSISLPFPMGELCPQENQFEGGLYYTTCKWLYMKYIGTYNSVEILLTCDCN